MSTEVISQEISNIQDEDLLRRMWQQTEDIARKREIRSHMYNLRESRLQEYHSSSDITEETHARSIPGSLSGSRRASLVDENQQLREVRTPEYSSKGVYEPPVIREEAYSLCKSTDGMDCKAKSKSMIAHESGRTDGVEQSVRSGDRAAEDQRFNGSNAEKNIVTSQEGHLLQETSSTSESSSKYSDRKMTSTVDERKVMNTNHMKGDSTQSELISREVQHPDANTIVITEIRKLPDGRTVTSTHKEMRSAKLSGAKATSTSSASSETIERYEQSKSTSGHVYQHEVSENRDVLNKLTPAITKAIRDVDSMATSSHTDIKDLRSSQLSNSQNEHYSELRTNMQKVAQTDHAHKAIYANKSEKQTISFDDVDLLSRTIEYPDARTKIIKEVRKAPDGGTFTKTFTEIQETQHKNIKNKSDVQARQIESRSSHTGSEQFIRRSVNDEVIKRSEKDHAGINQDRIDKEVAHPDQFTTIITETRVLPDGRKVTTKHTEIKGNERASRNLTFAEATSTVVDDRKHTEQTHKSKITDHSVSKQKHSGERFGNKKGKEVSRNTVTKQVSEIQSLPHEKNSSSTYVDRRNTTNADRRETKQTIVGQQPNIESEPLIDLRHDIRVNEIVTEKLAPSPYDDSFSSASKISSSVKKDLSADVELIDVERVQPTRTNIETNGIPKPEKIVSLPQQEVDKTNPSRDDYISKPQDEKSVSQKDKMPNTTPVEPIPQRTRISEDISPTHHAFASSLRADGVFMPGRKSPASIKSLRSDSPKYQSRTPTKESSRFKPHKSATSPNKTTQGHDSARTKQPSPLIKPVDKMSPTKRHEPQTKKEPKSNIINKVLNLKPSSKVDAKIVPKSSHDGDSSPTTTVSDLEFVKPELRREIPGAADMTDKYESHESYEDRCRTLLGMFDKSDSTKFQKTNKDESFISKERVMEEKDRKLCKVNGKKINSKTIHKKHDKNAELLGSSTKTYSPSSSPDRDVKYKHYTSINNEEYAKSKGTEASYGRISTDIEPTYMKREKYDHDYRLSKSQEVTKPDLDFLGTTSPSSRDSSPTKLDYDYPRASSKSRDSSPVKLDCDYPMISPKFKDNSPNKSDYDYPRKLPKATDFSPIKSDYDYLRALPKSRDSSPIKSDCDYPRTSPKSGDSSLAKPDHDYPRILPRSKDFSPTKSDYDYPRTLPKSKVFSPTKSDYDYPRTSPKSRDSSPTKPDYDCLSTSPKSRDSSPAKPDYDYPRTLPKSKDFSQTKSDYDYPRIVPKPRDTSSTKPYYDYEPTTLQKSRDSSPTGPVYDYPRTSPKSRDSSPMKSDYDYPRISSKSRDGSPTGPVYDYPRTSPKSRETSPIKSDYDYPRTAPKSSGTFPRESHYDYPRTTIAKTRDDSTSKSEYEYSREMVSTSKDASRTSQKKTDFVTSSKSRDSVKKGEYTHSKTPSSNTRETLRRKPVVDKLKYTPKHYKTVKKNVDRTSKITTEHPSRRPILYKPHKDTIDNTSSRGSSPRKKSSFSPTHVDSTYNAMDEVTVVHSTTRKMGHTLRSSPDGSPERDTGYRESYSRSSEYDVRGPREHSPTDKLPEYEHKRLPYTGQTRKETNDKSTQKFISHEKHASLFEKTSRDKYSNISEDFLIQETVERTPDKSYMKLAEPDLKAPRKKIHELPVQESPRVSSSKEDKVAEKDFSNVSKYSAENTETQETSKHKYYSTDRPDLYESKELDNIKSDKHSQKYPMTSRSPSKIGRDFEGFADNQKIKFTTVNTRVDRSVIEASKNSKENQNVKTTQKNIQHRTNSAPIGRESSHKYTTRTVSDNVVKLNEQKTIKHEDHKKSDTKQDIAKHRTAGITSPRAARNEELSKETARLVSSQEKLLNESTYAKSHKGFSSTSRPEQIDHTKVRQSHDAKRERPKIRKFPNLDDPVISTKSRDTTEYGKTTTKQDTWSLSNILASDKSTFKTSDTNKVSEFRDRKDDYKSNTKILRDGEKDKLATDHFPRTTDKVTKFVTSAEEITKPIGYDENTDETCESDSKMDYSRYNVSKMVSKFNECSFTEELEKDADEMETDYQYKPQHKKDYIYYEGVSETARDHLSPDNLQFLPPSVPRTTMSPIPLRSTEAVKKAKLLFENIIQQEACSKRDSTGSKPFWGDKKSPDLGDFDKKENQSPEPSCRNESDALTITNQRSKSIETRAKSTSLKDIYDIKEDHISKSHRTGSNKIPDLLSYSKSEYCINERNTKFTRESTVDQYASRSGSRASEYSSINLSRTASPKNAVKFGVTLRRTDADTAKNETQSKSEGHPLIFPAIQDTFDIKVLEEMLESSTSYDIRRKIRAQIRLIKRNDNKTKTKPTTPRLPPKRNSPVRNAPAKVSTNRSQNMKEKTEYQDSYCTSISDYKRSSATYYGDKPSSRADHKKRDDAIRNESPSRTYYKHYDSSPPRSLSPDNKMQKKSFSEHLWSAKTMSSSLKERPRIRKSSPEYGEHYTYYDNQNLAESKDSQERDESHVYRTITTKEYIRNNDEPSKQTKTHYTCITSNANAPNDLDKSGDNTAKSKTERKSYTLSQKSSSDKNAKNVRNVSTKGRVGTRNATKTTPRSILESSAVTSMKIAQRDNVREFSEKKFKKRDETNLNEKFTRFSKTGKVESRDPLKKLFSESNISPTRDSKTTVYRHEGIDDDGYLVTTYTIEKTGVCSSPEQMNLSKVSSGHLEDIWDEEILNSLLEQCSTYDERRSIRSRLRQVMAEQKERMAESSKSFDAGSKAITSKTVTTKTTSISSMTSQNLSNKPISPFAKFRQLDKQHSLNSPPSTPKTPGTPGAGGVLFKFTDSELARSASSVKDRLLYWAQVKTKEYENIKIENFSTSWADGLAFCALIHHFLPDAFDYQKLNPKNRRYNFTLAFRVADEKAGIAPLLDVEDMVMMRKPDWKCVFTYVQSIYRRFKDED